MTTTQHILAIKLEDDEKFNGENWSAFELAMLTEGNTRGLINYWENKVTISGTTIVAQPNTPVNSMTPNQLKYIQCESVALASIIHNVKDVYGFGLNPLEPSHKAWAHLKAEEKTLKAMVYEEGEKVQNLTSKKNATSTSIRSDKSHPANNNCKGIGHTLEEYWKLGGGCQGQYPPWWKGKQDAPLPSGSANLATTSQSDHGSITTNVIALNACVNKKTLEEIDKKTAGEDMAWVINNHNPGLDTSQMYGDSGASTHFVQNRDHFFNYIPLETSGSSSKVGVALKVLGTGTVAVKTTTEGVEKIITFNKEGWKIIFGGGRADFMDLSRNSQFMASMFNDLYMINCNLMHGNEYMALADHAGYLEACKNDTSSRCSPYYLSDRRAETIVWPWSGPGLCEPGPNLNQTHRFRFGPGSGPAQPPGSRFKVRPVGKFWTRFRPGLNHMNLGGYMMDISSSLKGSNSNHTYEALLYPTFWTVALYWNCCNSGSLLCPRGSRIKYLPCQCLSWQMTRNKPNVNLPTLKICLWHSMVLLREWVIALCAILVFWLSIPNFSLTKKNGTLLDS
ncbi:hypothetical protein ARMSODRAFT_973906 [Armillaria solidipes]|uniref:Retrovirus-related Pol polyprotein from transposon TNT 1-94-like beta-barrel domain-containing protein n=1 Tax=Armillaria solidipes TaxID=1076256 RepID=A0A2H3BLN9_9AGAR|nr:hypothetical protein ARMSODRAFT_973906 [Armillaria solidipes]